MTKPTRKEQQLADLKQHFGRRALDQARLVVNSWRSLDEVGWNEDWVRVFSQRLAKLHRLAERYGSGPMRDLAATSLTLLDAAGSDKRPAEELIEQLDAKVHSLAQQCSRRDDNSSARLCVDSRKPAYLCCDHDAETLRQHLDFFGIPVEVIADRDALMLAIHNRRPAAMLANVEFDGDGPALIAEAQQILGEPVPAYFHSQTVPTMATRLAAARANGVAFQEGDLDAGVLVKQLSDLYAHHTQLPYRVLIVEDSKSQAFFAQRSLSQAGMVAEVVEDPLTILDALDEFQPDAILMDMYMPQCNGIELARVIRQQWRYDAVPILYLSAEQDAAKQLEAMAQGGDDFLTKPVAPDMLVATVRNRCERNRGLKDKMIRDSLTGLLDHINTLEVLKRSIHQVRSEGRQLCFAMIDLDHFKAVNDRYGHAVGDSVIRSLALYLRQRFRLTDRIGRYGGEEFAVILHDVDLVKAGELLEAVGQGFARLQHRAGDERISVTFSCGIAELSQGQGASDLSKAADDALYQAKEAGRNRVQLADQG